MLGPDRRRVGVKGRDGIDGDGQFVEIIHHRFRGIARLRLGLRDDHRHRLADMAHRVGRQDRVRIDRGRRAVTLLDWNHAGQVAEMGGVFGADHGENAGHRPHLVEIGQLEPAMGERRADDDEAGGVLRHQVGEKTALAGNEIGVLKPLHGRADTELHMSCSLNGCGEWTRMRRLAGKRDLPGRYPQARTRASTSPATRRCGRSKDQRAPRKASSDNTKPAMRRATSGASIRIRAAILAGPGRVGSIAASEIR